MTECLSDKRQGEDDCGGMIAILNGPNKGQFAGFGSLDLGFWSLGEIFTPKSWTGSDGIAFRGVFAQNKSKSTFPTDVRSALFFQRRSC